MGRDRISSLWGELAAAVGQIGKEPGEVVMETKSEAVKIALDNFAGATWKYITANPEKLEKVVKMINAVQDLYTIMPVNK